MADGILTPWHDHDIDFARWLHPAMWHVALESWQWLHQVAAPCTVISDSGMTCHWIHPMAAPCNVTRSFGIMTLNWAGGSTLQCGRWLLGWHATEFGQTSAILEFYIWFRFRPYHRSRHVILHQSPKFYPNRTTLGRKKITSCRFSRWRISAILYFLDPIMGSLKSPIT